MVDAGRISEHQSRNREPCHCRHSSAGSGTQNLWEMPTD
jgi:hypothetical protein